LHIAGCVTAPDALVVEQLQLLAHVRRPEVGDGQAEQGDRVALDRRARLPQQDAGGGEHGRGLGGRVGQGP
jgi:hypothetical protein